MVFYIYTRICIVFKCQNQEQAQQGWRRGQCLFLLAIQFNQQHNPMAMATNYPLSSVPEDAMLIKEENHSERNSNSSTSGAVVLVVVVLVEVIDESRFPNF